MNREIKFRGKTIDGLWEYGGLWIDKGKYYINGTDNNWWEVIPETVGQFTNRYDWNGIEIYEYDILSHESYKNNYKVKYMNGTLAFVEISNEEHIHIISVSHYFGINYFKIIGNIHDNPELLEIFMTRRKNNAF